MIKLANNNETIQGEHRGVTFTLKFHDDTTKLNINLGGNIHQAFAIFGQDIVSERRKAFQAMIKAYIDTLLDRGTL